MKTGNRAPRLIASLIIFLLFFLIYMHPYLVNGFWDDDSPNSNVPYFAARFGSDTLSFAVQVSRAWLFEYGRINVAWPYIYGFFAMFGGNENYVRLAHVTMILVDIGLGMLLLRIMKFEWAFCLLYGLLIVAQFQIRNTFDPVAAGAGFFSGLHILLTISLLFLVRFMESGKKHNLIISTTLVFITFLAYEVNVVYYIILFTLFIYFRHKFNIYTFFISIAPLSIFIFLNFVIRKNATKMYNGVAPGTAHGFLSTFPDQFLSVLPLSYYYGSSDFSEKADSFLMAAFSDPMAVAVMVLFTSAILVLPLNKGYPPPNQWGTTAVVIAAAQWIIPASLVAVSAKYQDSVTFGNGYALIYYQYFGSALFLAMLVFWFSSAKLFRLIFAASAAVTIGVQFEVNTYLQTQRDHFFKIPRQALETFLKTTEASAIKDGDTLSIEGSYPGADGNTVFKVTGKRVHVINETQINTEQWFPGKNSPSNNGCYFDLRYVDGAWQLTAQPCLRATG